MAEYLHVKNWEQFQHYKDREPKWIKLYRSLLMDYKYEKLSDSEFGQIVKIWLLASQMENKIPNDPAWVQKKCSMSQKPNLIKYVQLGFLQQNGSVQICTETYKTVLREEKRREDKDTYLCIDNLVEMTDQELKKLLDRFGEPFTLACIEKLKNGKGAKGYKYKSDYRAILNWVVDTVKDKVPIQTEPVVKPKPLTGAKCHKCGKGGKAVPLRDIEGLVWCITCYQNSG